MKNSASKKDIYESYEMISPENSFMAFVTKKRAEWYVSKNLAYWVDDKKFKLKFNPKGLGKNNLPFYTEKLENKCVVCGAEKHINKHHVLPYVFRSRLPNIYKNNNHHDILAICVSCHENYETEAMKLKIKLMQEQGIEVNRKLSDIERTNKEIIKAKKLLEKINNNQIDVNKIPNEKLENIKTLSLKNVVEVEEKHWADDYMVYLDTEDKIFSFIKLWRLHFLETTNPKYLPKFWDLNHPLEVN